MAIRTHFRVLVTGGSGFLGRNIVKALLQRHPEWEITIFDIQSPEAEFENGTARYVCTDITSPESVNAAFENYRPDLVVHTAGIVPAREQRYSRDNKVWERVKAINYQGTVNIVDATLRSGCRRMVYTSSCTTVIDDLNHDYYLMKEDIPLGFANLHYGKSKGLAERYVLSSEHAEQGFKACALRPCTIIGPGDVAVMSVFHDLIAKGETYFVVGSGDNVYDFMYIDNAVEAHILAVENLMTTQTAAGHAFFISNQEPVYFWDFLSAIWAQFGHVPKFQIFIPYWLARIVAFVLEIITYCTGASTTLDSGSVQDAVRTHFSDNSKAIEILGYKPKVGLVEGVRRSCDDYKNYLAAKELQQPKTPA